MHKITNFEKNKMLLLTKEKHTSRRKSMLYLLKKNLKKALQKHRLAES